MLFEEFKKTAAKIYKRAAKEKRLLDNPTSNELRNLTLEEPDVRLTAYNSISILSEPKSRAAEFTKNNMDNKFDKEEARLLEQAEQYLSKENLISIDAIVGDGSEGITARLIVPKKFAHLPYAGLKLFMPTKTDNPTYQVIMFFDEEYEKNKSKTLPKKDITIRLAYNPKGEMIKIARNANYFGEWKKGVFAGEDWRAKREGDAIFLHAGCRQDKLWQGYGGYKTQNSLFVALSANGKTSLTCKVLARKSNEVSWLVQDDGGILARDGSFIGFEMGALYVKTEHLSPEDQIEIYYATLKPNSVLENVFVDGKGEVDFTNLQITSNGRAVVERRDFMHASKDINVEKIDNLFIITRGPIIPAVAKLTLEEAAAYMVIGQAMESSAGDPTKAGQIKNEFFYDPFASGNRVEHANLFYDILKDNPHIKCYLLNTGWIGEGDQYRKIILEETLNILDSILRGGLDKPNDWVKSEANGLMIPVAVRNIDDQILLHPEKRYAVFEFEERQKDLDKCRAETLEKYIGLHPSVRKVFLK